MSLVSACDNKLLVAAVAAASTGLSAYALYRLLGQSKTDSVPGSDIYESEKLLSEYLVFHFGSPDQLIPYPFGPKNALDFPKRCAELCLKHAPNQGDGTRRALDIGCAVGRSSFELARKMDEVIGIDYSQSFIDAADKLRRDGRLAYDLLQEGDIFTPAVATVPGDIDRTRVSFEQGDACDLRPSLGSFDVVLAANLICRLHHPKDFLKRLSELVKPGCILVITAPYTWLRDFTDKSRWLGGYEDANGQNVTGFTGLKKELGSMFDLVEDDNMPFFIRETCRKNQWTVAHATVWRRK